VCEPYIFLKESPLTNYKETVMKSDGINMDNILSKLLENYLRSDKEPEKVDRSEELRQAASTESLEERDLYERDAEINIGAVLESVANRVDKKRQK
jgi:hypothetical protein